ncbi:hypothetical protein SCANM63S_10320 [Streptomyces canarius]
MLTAARYRSGWATASFTAQCAPAEYPATAQPWGAGWARKLSMTIFGTSMLSQVSALTCPGMLAQPVSTPASRLVRGATRMNGATRPLLISGSSCSCALSDPNHAFAEPG